MRSIRSLLMVSFLSMALASLASGCAMDAAAEGEELDPEVAVGDEVGAPEEAVDEIAGAQDVTDVAVAPGEAAVKGEPGETSARENGDWCHANCYNDRTYAGPNVTANCNGWGDMVCAHRGTTLFRAFWCKFGDCWVDVVLW